MKRYISLIHDRFGPKDGQIKGYPGHPEIELALLRFFSVTGHQESYQLAKFFLEERGNPKGQEDEHYYTWEADKRGESRWLRPDTFPVPRSYWYAQAHLPIRDQPTIEGHSVRAMYLLTAAADLVHLSNTSHAPLEESDRQSWVKALERLWDNMVNKKMYVTGGIGAIKRWEGFGIDYFLPQGTDEGGCYSETCASIGVIMLAERLLHLDLDGHYADIMELSLYNNVMTAMSINGKEFTYDNQLASSVENKSARSDWFECACCPPNLTRLYGSLGGYLWDYGASNGQAFVNVHLYTSAEMTFKATEEASVTIRQKSNWPWEGNILFEVSSPPNLPLRLRLRMPAWSQGQFALTPTPKTGTWEVEKGYLVLSEAYVSENPVFALEIKGFAPRYLSPHPYTNQRTLTLARGPIVYCVEDVDNEWETNHFKDVVIKTDSPITEERRTDSQTRETYVALRSIGWTRSLSTSGSHDDDASPPRDLVFIPYYYRSNRGGNGQMRVGLVNGGTTLGHVFPER